MSEITQQITTLPAAPSRANPSTFVSLADAFLAVWENTPNEINTWADQANTLASEMETNVNDAAYQVTLAQAEVQNCKDEVVNCQTEVQNCKDQVTLAQTATNYKGEYSATTTYDITESVSYNNRVWVSKVNNNLGNTPTEGVYWTLRQNIPEVLTKTANYTILSADCNGSKTVINAGTTIDIVLTLPTAAVGLAIQFCVEESYYIRLNADGTDTFSYGSDTGAAGGYIRANTVGTVWKIECFVAGKWRITTLTGTLKYDE